jgi:hypothetical protein
MLVALRGIRGDRRGVQLVKIGVHRVEVFHSVASVWRDSI